MSHMWMRMPGQSWPGAAASFLGMWIGMTAAMMLPSLVPTLRRYARATHGAGEARRALLVVFVALAYFAVWILAGAIVFPICAALMELQMRQPSVARVVPVAVGAVIAIAGAVQLSAWKARHLAQCREPFQRGDASGISVCLAWRQGLRLGVDCVYSCAGAMAVLLVVGMMDMRVMAVATVAITVERVAPAGAHISRLSGAAAVGVGLVLAARAAALGGP